MQLHMIPNAISASLGRWVWMSVCVTGLKGAVQEKVGTAYDQRPKSKRDKTSFLIGASDDPGAKLFRG